MEEKALVHGAVEKHLGNIAGQLSIFLERILLKCLMTGGIYLL